jgi:hypothetical protein
MSLIDVSPGVIEWLRIPAQHPRSLNTRERSAALELDSCFHTRCPSVTYATVMLGTSFHQYGIHPLMQEAHMHAMYVQARVASIQSGLCYVH